MVFVEGLVIAVPRAKKDEYIRFSNATVPYFRRHGALTIVETWESDVPDGEVTSFPKAVHRKPDEAIVFSWITWPDKATRDAAYPKMFEAMEASGDGPGDPPFDGKRMIFGGFETIVDA